MCSHITVQVICNPCTLFPDIFSAVAPKAVRCPSHQGFCHRNCYTCFGPATGLPALLRTLHDRRTSAPEGSYTRKLYTDNNLLASKLIEEAIELSEVCHCRASIRRR